MDGKGNSYRAGKSGAARKGNTWTDTDFDLSDELYTDDTKWTVDDLDLPDISTNARQTGGTYRSTSGYGTENRQKRPAGSSTGAARRVSGSSAGTARRTYRSGTGTERRTYGSGSGTERRAYESSSGTERRAYGSSADRARRTSGSSRSGEYKPEDRDRSYDRVRSDRENRDKRSSDRERSEREAGTSRISGGDRIERDDGTARDGASMQRRRASGTSQNRDREKRRTGRDAAGMTVSPLYIGAAAGVLLIVILIIVGVRSCNNNHKSSQNVVKELITAFVDGNEKKMKDSYGINGEATVDVQEELDAAQAYYKAHNVKKLEITSTGTLFREGDYTYVYIVYDLLLENDQKYPCIGTYIVQKVEDKYYVLTPSKVTEDLSEKATTAYKKFMKTETYKKYTMDYETFIKKNPGYEDKIASKLL